MKNKTLALKLATTEKESQIINILKKAGYWNSRKHWKNYGQMENNFSIIGNQQANADNALTEKLVNSVDAVLINESLKRGIHPESSDAPESVKTAVQDFFGVYNGSLTNIDARQRKTLAENIALVATGYKTRPTYTIIDKGEGQYPEKFHETFLSLAKSNKIKIPFVQGKFNMGGSGVLQFCGEHNMQFILSRRNRDISGEDASWGFTIVRRQEPKDGYKNSAYTYLAPKGKILTFEADALDIFPSDHPNPYGKPFKHGTFIKLYEYNMTSGLSTNLKFDLYNRLSALLPEAALPIRMYERRKGYSGKTMETTLSGLKVRLKEDRNNNVEEGYPSSFKFGDINAEMYVFRPKSHKNYKGNQGIIFTANGQTQGSLTQSFFNRKSVGMGSLEDSILIIVNCDDLSAKEREDLFMNSRDRLRYGDVRSRIESELEDYISQHEGLKELREKRRKERIKEDIEEQETFQDTMKKIIGNSKVLSSLFLGQKNVENPYQRLNRAAKKKFKGNKFPTYFDIMLEGVKKAHKGERFRVQYTTDAENDYLTRENEAGKYLLFHKDEKLDYTINLWNGFATVNVELPNGIKAGSTLTLRSELWDNSRFEPFEDEFQVEVKPPRKTEKGKNGKRKKPVSKKKGSHAPFKGLGSFPNIIEVHKEQWDEYGFKKDDCLTIINNGELGYDFAINVDNQYLLSELVKQDDEIQLTRLKWKYVVAIIGMALLQSDMEQDAKAISRILSPVILPITNINELNVKANAI